MSKEQTYQVRTEEQLRDALSRFCHGKVAMSIPVDYERDADMILSDGIKELMMLRSKVAEQESAIAGLKAEVADLEDIAVCGTDGENLL